MKKKIDTDAILAPIQGENPAGESLRYTPVYDEIKEARREEDTLERGDWRREIKRADWERVINLSVDALTNKTKDLQIAVWLTEALIKTEGFSGLTTGIQILTGFLKDYWDHVYPEIEEGDLDYRVGPLELLNNFAVILKQTPMTDIKATPGFSRFKWEESRQVGYEKETINQYGDVDEGKKQKRNELISEGKLTAEDFDAAVERSSKAYYDSLSETLNECSEAFRIFDETVDERFGTEAPRLAEMREAIEDCKFFAAKILKDKKESEPEDKPETETAAGPETEEPTLLQEDKNNLEVEEDMQPSPQAVAAEPLPVIQFSDAASIEKAMWQEALKKLKSGGIKEALDQLYKASCSMPSVREQNRYRLLMAKLCLKAERPDLARPVVEKLYALIEELQLERWESPMWIAEVFETLYQCLTAGTPSDDDTERSIELFKRICTIDVTKAMSYKH